MTAYGGVLSLRNTINNIICCSRFRLVGGSLQIIQGVYNKLDPLKETLQRLDETSPSRSRKKVNALDGRIKEAIWRFEDSLESLLTRQIPSQYETLPEIVSIDLQSLENDADSLFQKLNDMEEEYVYEVDNMPQDEPVSSFFGFHGTNSKMIGLSDQFEEVKRDLLRFLDYPGWKHVYGLYGTAGVGKTTLAKEIYQDPNIQLIYKRRAWVTVGRVPQPISQISRGVLAQLMQGDERILRGKNCLIVLDDVWEREIFDFLNRSIPCVESGCVQVLLTCRHKKWFNVIPFGECNEVRFLNEEESMDLLCEKVFGDEFCPPQLHKSATKIAKLCEGLPLLILTVADILSKSEQNRDPAYWNEVAERRNSVFKDAYDRISKVLFPSYNYLPQCLKMPFLFLGVFPYDTPPSKIIDMLTAEGLWDEWDCLRELAIEYSLVLRIWKSVDKTSHELYVREYKTCRLHSSWRHVCRGEASNKKFYHVLNKLIDASEECLIGQRGLCLENNVLFGIKEFCDSIRLHCTSFTRSLLSYGPYHQYPIPIDVGFKLLREIDILTQRFYTFPLEILSLVHLKYLALTCNGEIPTTISKLFNLRVLIMHPHLSIRCCKAPSYVPIQIWDMQALEHIEILGKSLVTSSHVNLYNLSTLVGVNASICTISELSRKIPNIKKLGIEIELTPYDDHFDLLSCFGCISTLSLDTLKLSITNPVIKHDHFFSVNPKSLKLPHYLMKLHLTGMGFPWDYMDAIGSLPYLQVLKLRSYAFQGPRWKTGGRSFPNVEFLLIEESDLVQWTPGKSFPRLKYLSMKHCYKLVDICCYEGEPTFLDQYICTTEIELEDCNPLTLIWASQLRPRVGSRLRVIASSSFDEKPTTVKFERY